MIAHAVERTPATPQTRVRSPVPVSPGVDFVFHLNSGATSFGRDVKPRSRLRAATAGKRTLNPLPLPLVSSLIIFLSIQPVFRNESCDVTKSGLIYP